MNLETLNKLRNGDHTAFCQVYEDWHKQVYFYFHKLRQDEYVAKELTQQTFIKLWRYRSDVSSQISIDQQIFQKARLIYIDWLRKEATYRKYFTNDEVMELHQIAETDEVKDLRPALNYLPPKRKKVFELKHIHGYSYKEIAEHLGISIKTVDNHLLKATAQLRKAFGLYNTVGIILLTTI